MSLRDVSIFYVLGEDAAHRTFIRAWLRANRVDYRRIHTVLRPTAGGISFVLAHCKDTVDDAQRRDRTRGKTRVIIALDADEDAVNERAAKIYRAIASDDAVDQLKVVCVLVPKRHIETWVQALGSSEPVDETTDYKDKSTREIQSAARALARLQSPPSAPPSLVHGYEQISRLKKS